MFNDVQDHLLRAARVHVDRVVLEAFVAGLERCPDPAARALLSRLCDLYVLATIEADLAWFLAHGRLTPTRAKSVTSAVNSSVPAAAAARADPGGRVRDPAAVPGRGDAAPGLRLWAAADPLPGSGFSHIR